MTRAIFAQKIQSHASLRITKLRLTLANLDSIWIALRAKMTLASPVHQTLLVAERFKTKSSSILVTPDFILGNLRLAKTFASNALITLLSAPSTLRQAKL